MMISRRHMLGFLGSAPLAQIARSAATAAPRPISGPAQVEKAEPFSFDDVKASARALAQRPFVDAPVIEAAVMNGLDYDAYQQIRYHPDRTLTLGADHDFLVQFFHVGKHVPRAVRIALVKQGVSRNVPYDRSLFAIPEGNPALMLPQGTGFGGLRLMTPDLRSDYFSAVGATYFRSSSPFDQYGLSARGIAVNTACSAPEEFPRFTQFWLEAPATPGAPLMLYATMDGESITGAYQMAIQRVLSSEGRLNTEIAVEANLFLRTNVERIGIAPFSSMFWYGEAAVRQPRDWRPEIHDSDGLAMWTGGGERIWRPLRNPPHVTTNAFGDKNPRGFGLLQRDREFDHYLDDGVFYDKRPSVWVEPLDGWGEGAFHLIEMPTGEETWDNVVAYWCPSDFNKAGQEKTFRYKMTWCGDIPFPSNLGRAVGTWIGIGGPPGLSYKERNPNKVKIVIDFEAEVFRKVDASSGVAAIVNASRGQVSNIASYPVAGSPDRWRAVFDLEASGLDPVDLRAYLRQGDGALSETWIYQFNPVTS